jgi:hypothetical protein
MLLLFAAPGFAQETPPAKDGPKPEATAPQAAQPSPDSAQRESTPNPDNQPPSAPAQQEQTASPQQPASPPQAVPPQTNAQETVPSPQKAQPAKAPCSECKTKALVKRSPSKERARKKPVRSATAPEQFKTSADPDKARSSRRDKVVVTDGGARGDAVQLSTGGTKEQQLHNRENTAELLATTEENLKRLAGRQLSQAQKSTVEQIRSYMQQAKSAANSGDLARAHTLAYKAHLLSDDLARQ